MVVLKCAPVSTNARAVLGLLHDWNARDGRRRPGGLGRDWRLNDGTIHENLLRGVAFVNVQQGTIRNPCEG
jgi:hypothetical protein